MSGAEAAWRLTCSDAVLQGMLHLHLCDPPIIHRDLKSPNLLVDKHWKLKVHHALLVHTCWTAVPVCSSVEAQASGAPNVLLLAAFHLKPTAIQVNDILNQRHPH